MTTTLRACRQPGCGQLTTHGLCPQHRRQRDNTTTRGYTGTHRKLRAQWAPIVATGTTPCARCGQPITPNQPWDLGHTDDRTTWTGPEHANCNRATNTHRTQGE